MYEFRLKDPASDKALLSRLNSDEKLSYELCSGYIETDLKGKDLMTLYHVFKQAFIGGDIATTKPIGFAISSAMGSEDSVIHRNRASCESVSEIANYIQEITFVGECGAEFGTDQFVNKAYTGHVLFKSNQKEVPVIRKEQYLCTAMQPMSIIVVVTKAKGLVPMVTNVSKLSSICMFDNSYTFFPLITDHTLTPYIRILPCFGNAIFFGVDNDIDVNLLSKLWSDYVEEKKLNE